MRASSKRGSLLEYIEYTDGIGYAVDSLLDPLSWFVTPFAADFGRAAAKTVNDRADNLKLYQDVEDSSLDLYAAVRNGYLQRRQKSIAEAIRQRDGEQATELFFAHIGDLDQRAMVEGISGDDVARTAQNRDQIRP